MRLCNKDHSIFGSILGPLVFGNSHVAISKVDI